MDPARGVAGSSIVTAMSRNGTDFGIRVGGTGDTWFTAPVEMPRGLYFPGFSEADANPDIGDSTIVETVGLGGFAMAAAPAVAGFVGAGTAADALAYTHAMYEITVGRNPDWTLAALDYVESHEIDVPKVVETGIAPTINTGIAHREPGIGQVGAGVVRAPMACFERGPGSLGSGVEGGVSGARVINRVRRAFYLDSVALMRLSREISERSGVEEAALMIGTPSNKEILDEAGLLRATGGRLQGATSSSRSGR